MLIADIRRMQVYQIGGIKMSKALAAILAATLFCFSFSQAALAADRSVQIAFPKYINVILGSKPDFKPEVSAVDDRGVSAKVFIDSSKVDTGVHGTYKVIYRAYGLNGGKSEQEGLVAVTKCDPEKACTLLDGVLGKILNDGMTEKEKAKAIFDFAKEEIKYRAGVEKVTSLDSAYFGLTKATGDCYTSAALLEQLYTRAGIANVFVAGQHTEANAHEHYWVMIDIGGGWYHCDAVRGYKGVDGFTGFMFPESQAMKQPSGDGATDRYSYDKSLYPTAEWDN
jgi:transglutaminase-like putative cysteine protease